MKNNIILRSILTTLPTIFNEKVFSEEEMLLTLKEGMNDEPKREL
jgi:hypothetical protein